MSRTKWCKLCVLCQGGRACLAASYTQRNINPNPLLCYCMHAGTAASPQQTSHVQQQSTKRSAMGHTMAHSKDQQTGSSRTLDKVLKPLKYLQRRVLLLLCRVIEGCCSDSLSGVAVEEEVTGKIQEKTTKINHLASQITPRISACARGMRKK